MTLEMAQMSVGDAPSDPTTVLVSAYKLKAFVSAFYTKGLETTYPTPFRADERDVLTQIAKHEAGHVAVLEAALGAAAPARAAVSSYDFSGGGGSGCGPFRGALGAPAGTSPTNSAVAETPAEAIEFFKLATVLEDLCARALKGSLTALLGTAHVSSVYRMQMVDAQHSAAIRLVRSAYPSGNAYVAPLTMTSLPVQPTVSKSSGGTGFADPAYTGTAVYPGGLSQHDIINGIATTTTTDGVTVQAITMAGVYGPIAPSSSTPKASATEDNEIQASSQVAFAYLSSSQEAFDEPLPIATAATLAALFGVV